MYAVFESGGQQHRVKAGDVVRLEKLTANEGDAVVFDKVLMVKGEADDSLTVGSPFVDGATVKAEVVSQTRGEKIRIIKFKRRKHHMKRMGHRQYYTHVKVTSIDA